MHVLNFDAHGKGLPSDPAWDGKQVSSGNTWGREALANTLSGTGTAMASWGPK